MMKRILIEIGIYISVFIFSFVIVYTYLMNKKNKEKNKLKEVKEKKSFLTKILKNKYKLIGIIIFFILTISFNIIFGIVGLIVILKLPKKIEKYKREKYIEKFNLQLIDGLTLIANSLKSGASFIQAVEVMVDEFKAPISEKFKEFLMETRMGISIKEALNNLSVKIKSDELKIAVTAINIARETGGNLSEILLHISDTIRERERIKGKISALTSQGKMSGFVIGSLPIGLAVILYFIDPIMMSPLFKTFIGQIVILIVVIMEFVGFKWINKIINIKI